MNILKLITDLRVEVYSGQSAEETDIDLHIISQNILKIQNKLDVLVKSTPNDQDLGNKIRKIYYENKY